MKLNTCQEDIKNKRIYLLNKDNPYKEGTMEWGLIQCLIDNLGTYVEQDLKTNEKNDSKPFYNLGVERDWLRYLADKDVNIDVDTWSYSRLYDYAITLGKVNGIISLSANSYDESSVAHHYPLEVSNRELAALRAQRGELPRFAVFIEDGLCNVLTGHFIMELRKQKGKTYHDLMPIAYQEDRLRKLLKLPQITFDHDGFTLNFKRNGSSDPIYSWNIASFPMAPWNHPGDNEDWLGFKSRGLYHHIGDTLGFIYAASQYGECYLVGVDEFGDLIVLGNTNNSDDAKFPIFSKVSAMDFDFVYGVPKGEATVMTKQNYLTVNTQECRVNTNTNTFFSDNFWNNEVFLDMASRKCSLMSYSEIINMVEQKSFQVFDEYMTEDVRAIMSDEMSQEEKDHFIKAYNELHNMPTLFNPIINLFEAFEQHPVLKNIFQDDDYPLGLYHENKLPMKTIVEIMHNVLLDMPALVSVMDIFKQFAFHPHTKLEYHDPLVFNLTKKRLSNFFRILENNKYYALAKILLSQTELRNKVYEASSFFYKTTAHKVHCDIINPARNLELGFFNKNDGNKKAQTEVNLYDYVLNRLKNKVGALFSQNLTQAYYNQSINDYVYHCLKSSITEKANHELIDYWYKIDSKSFLVSEIRNMRNEYRIFIVDNQIAAATPCQRNTTPMNAWNNGRLDPRLADGHNAQKLEYNQDTRDRVAKYARFAREFIRRSKVKYPKTRNYVLDVAWCEELACVIPIEINSITWSGAYQLNFDRVCAAVAGVPYRYESLFETQKNGSWYRFSSIFEKSIALAQMTEGESLSDIPKIQSNGLYRTALSGNLSKYKTFNFDIRLPADSISDDESIKNNPIAFFANEDEEDDEYVLVNNDEWPSFSHQEDNSAPRSSKLMNITDDFENVDALLDGINKMVINEHTESKQSDIMSQEQLELQFD